MPLEFNNWLQRHTGPTGNAGIALNSNFNAIVAHGRHPTSVKTASYNAVAGDLVLCDNDAVGSFTVTLPATPAAGDVIAVLLKTNRTDWTRTITIARNGKLIGGQAADLTLYIGSNQFFGGDQITLMYDGVNSWVVLSDDRIPHANGIRNATIQNFVNNTLTQVQFDTLIIDRGGIADLAGNRCVVRRTGFYDVAARIQWNGSLGSGADIEMFVRVNGVNFAQASYIHTSNSINFVNPFLVIRRAGLLVAGDLVTVFARQASGGNLNTFTDIVMSPQLGLLEESV